MKPNFSLEDILPPTPEFFVTAKKRSFKIRPPNMYDSVWFKNSYPEKRIKEIFGALDWVEISRIVYHQLDDADRREFPAQTAIAMDAEGHEKEVKVTGPEALLVSLADHEEALNMLQALTRAIMLSNKGIASYVEEELKKNLKVSPPPAPAPTVKKKRQDK